MAKDSETLPRIAPEITDMRRTYRPTAPTIELARESDVPVLDSRNDSRSKAQNRVIALKRTATTLDADLFVSYVYDEDEDEWLVYANRRPRK